MSLTEQSHTSSITSIPGLSQEAAGADAILRSEAESSCYLEKKTLPHHTKHNSCRLHRHLSLQWAFPFVDVIMWLRAQLISEGAADYEAPSDLWRWNQPFHTGLTTHSGVRSLFPSASPVHQQPYCFRRKCTSMKLFTKYTIIKLESQLTSFLYADLCSVGQSIFCLLGEIYLLI